MYVIIKRSTCTVLQPQIFFAAVRTTYISLDRKFHLNNWNKVFMSWMHDSVAILYFVQIWSTFDAFTSKITTRIDKIRSSHDKLCKTIPLQHDDMEPWQRDICSERKKILPANTYFCKWSKLFIVSHKGMPGMLLITMASFHT